MSQRAVGIPNNTTQIIVSGARVAFDSRTTEEVLSTIDPTNRKRRKPAKRPVVEDAAQAAE